MPASHRERPAREGRRLIRKEAIDTHTYHVNEGKDGKAGNPRPGAGGFVTLKERQQEPEQAGQGAPEHAEDLAVDEPDFRGDELEGLEHEEKVPLGLDAGGRGDKGIGLDAESPGKMAASAASTPMATYQAMSSRSRKLGRNFISRRAEGLAVHSASTFGGTLMPWS